MARSERLGRFLMKIRASIHRASSEASDESRASCRRLLFLRRGCHTPSEVILRSDSSLYPYPRLSGMKGRAQKRWQRCFPLQAPATDGSASDRPHWIRPPRPWSGALDDRLRRLRITDTAIAFHRPPRASIIRWPPSIRRSAGSDRRRAAPMFPELQVDATNARGAPLPRHRSNPRHIDYLFVDWGVISDEVATRGLRILTRWLALTRDALGLRRDRGHRVVHSRGSHACSRSTRLGASRPQGTVIFAWTAQSSFASGGSPPSESEKPDRVKRVHWHLPARSERARLRLDRAGPPGRGMIRFL